MKTRIKIGFSLSLLSLFFVGWSFASTTGSFFTNLGTQKDTVLSLYDSGYARVYQKFELTGAAVMRSLNYQSLVCLGVMNNGSFLNDMQNDLKKFKINFLNEHNTILTSFLELEQKKRLYEDSKVNLFSYGSYDKDLAILSGLYSQLLLKQTTNVADFQNRYLQAITNFIRDYTNYSKKNLDLISQVSSKIILLQELDTRFGLIKSALDTYVLNLAIVSKSPLFSNPVTIKSSIVSMIEQDLQKKLLIQTKKYPILKSLSGYLAVQKDLLVSEFVSYFDVVYDNFLGNWYPTIGYNTLKSKIDKTHLSYYSGFTYQCAPILSNTSFDLDIALLLKEVDQLSASFSSGSLNTGSFSVTGFQQKLSVLLSTVKTQHANISSKYTTFAQTTTKNLLEEHRKASDLSQNLPSSSLELPTDTNVDANVDPIQPSGFIAPVGFSFIQPFTTNQKHSDIIVLQGLLSSLGYYTGTINSIYTPSTKSAVYHFQLDRGILKGYEKKPQTWGWMGPATRSALNRSLN